MIILLVAISSFTAFAPAPAAAEPLPPAVPLPIYTRVTETAGLGAFLHAGFLGEDIMEPPIFTEITGPGACWIDHDVDGLLDLYLVNGVYQTHPEKNALLDPHSMLYRNDGDGTFTDVTTAAGARTQGVLQGCAAADYDNDADTDLFVTGWNGSYLLRNEVGSFTDVTDATGVRDAVCGDFACWSSSASWFDADLDGCLDLYVGHFTEFDLLDPPPTNGPGPGQKNRFFHGDCAGGFVDATAAAGLDDVKSDTWSSVSADLNNDGWPDLYVSNDGDANDVYLNDGDGTFTRDADSEAADGRSGMGTAIADFNKDGIDDIVTTNYISETNGVYRGTPGGGYFDIGMDAPFTDALNWSGWATHWFDMDNDARLDLMVLNGDTENRIVIPPEHPMLAYRNVDADGAFEAVNASIGPDFLQDYVGRGGAWADYDNDGDVDFLLAEAGENPTHLFRADGVGNNFLNVDVVGTGGVTRDAIGARVTVSASAIDAQRLDKVAGTAFLSSSDPRLHFGLDDAGTADVSVAWPDGTTESFAGVRANSFVRVTKGAGIETVQELPLITLTAPAEGVRRLDVATFDATAVLPPGRTIASVAWDFGDGTTATGGTTATHAYGDVGSFVVRAEVTDSSGARRVQWGTVAIWDLLEATIQMDADVFMPSESATGVVAVRFEDGTPVRNADVALRILRTTGDATLDERINQSPFFVQQFGGFVPVDIEGATDEAGLLPFTVPFNVFKPSPVLPPDANHPGEYIIEATGGARGSVFEKAAGDYAVVSGLL